MVTGLSRATSPSDRSKKVFALTYKLEDSGLDQGYFRRFIIHATTGMVLKRKDNDLTGEKKVVIIAGPNGSGKTTFALEFLPNEADCPNFINADLIASGLNPFSPEKAAIRAGKIMLDLWMNGLFTTIPN